MRRDLRRIEIKRSHLVGVGLLILGFSATAQDQSSEFRPAGFGVDNRLNRIEIEPGDLRPDSNTLAVRCQGFVELDGELTDPHCISDGFQLEDDYYPDRKVLSAVLDAIAEQTFLPAMAGDEVVRVLMSFSIFVECSSEHCQTIPVPHHGYHLQEYGFNYVAPQPILPDDDWYTGFDHKLRWVRDWMPNIRKIDNWPGWDRIPYTVAVEVGVNGAADDECIYWFKRVPNMGFVRAARALEDARDSLGSVRYIPGFFENRPVTMRFFESSILSDDAGSGNGIGGYPRVDC